MSTRDLRIYIYLCIRETALRVEYFNDHFMYRCSGGGSSCKAAKAFGTDEGSPLPKGWSSSILDTPKKVSFCLNLLVFKISTRETPICSFSFFEEFHSSIFQKMISSIIIKIQISYFSSFVYKRYKF